jgi:hypothetical protein
MGEFIHQSCLPKHSPMMQADISDIIYIFEKHISQNLSIDDAITRSLNKVVEEVRCNRGFLVVFPMVFLPLLLVRH